MDRRAVVDDLVGASGVWKIYFGNSVSEVLSFLLGDRDRIGLLNLVLHQLRYPASQVITLALSPTAIKTNSQSGAGVWEW